MGRDRRILPRGRDQSRLSIFKCSNCGKSCSDRIIHVNNQHGIYFFCNKTCKLNWIYVQFKGSKLRGILDMAMELVK